MSFQIAKCEQEIKDQRKKMGGIHNSTVKHIAIHKKKAVLENRLDKVRKLYIGINKHNKTVSPLTHVCDECKRIEKQQEVQYL